MQLKSEKYLNGEQMIQQLTEHLNLSKVLLLLEIIERTNSGEILEVESIDMSLVFILKSCGYDIDFCEKEQGIRLTIQRNASWGNDGYYLRRETINRFAQYYIGEQEQISVFHSKEEELYFLLYEQCKIRSEIGHFSLDICENNPIFDEYTEEEILGAMTIAENEGFFVNLNTDDSHLSLKW